MTRGEAVGVVVVGQGFHDADLHAVGRHELVAARERIAVAAERGVSLGFTDSQFAIS